MQIERVQMTRPHYEPGKPGRVRMIVLHATAGRNPGDLGWLRVGGDERRPVSVHYYISKAGQITQLVDDADIAWHAGQSRWTVDGREVNGCNAVSVGIELENLNSGYDPYPPAQYAAALWLCRDLAARHQVPRGQLVRHLDIAPGRKTDPAGFPWERFVAEVYASSPADTPGLPTTSAQLRARLLDLAYRSAGGALAAGWPFFAAAQAAHLGMPIAAPTGRPTAKGAGTAQDDQDRAVRVGSQGTFLIEIYARDLLYAPVGSPGGTPPGSDQVRRLSETPAGPLRDGLIDLLFRSADPVNGFHPEWAFHQYYTQHSGDLGVPIGPSQRLRDGGRAYTCQHFALDSLCSPINTWKSIYRLSELAAVAAEEQHLPDLSAVQAARLRRLLLSSLYHEGAGRKFDEGAALVRYALDHRLGAPLGQAEQIDLEDMQLLIMPFALDTIYCRLPSASWPYDRPLPAGTPVGTFSGTLGVASPGVPIGRLGDLACLADDMALSDLSVAPSYLLGPEEARPALHDLCDSPTADRLGTQPRADLLLLCSASGPAASDLAAEGVAARWHYYIDRAGAITRLRDERTPTRVAERVGQRAVVLAYEGELPDAEPAQRAALTWLVRALIVALNLNPNCIRTLNQPITLTRRHLANITTEGVTP
ncbi:MAG: N-acetylmuramoyl-L-alanine amidase [Chloroflexales bacterium]